MGGGGEDKMKEKKKILIVEDDCVVRKTLVEAINSAGKNIEVLETDNLEEAISIIQKTNLYALSIDNEFYTDKRRIYKGALGNDLAAEAKEYGIKKIIGVSTSPENFKPNLFTDIIDKSKMIFETEMTLEKYVTTILKK